MLKRSHAKYISNRMLYKSQLLNSKSPYLNIIKVFSYTSFENWLLFSVSICKISSCCILYNENIKKQKMEWCHERNLFHSNIIFKIFGEVCTSTEVCTKNLWQNMTTRNNVHARHCFWDQTDACDVWCVM